MHNESLKKLLVIAGASIILFWFFRPKKDAKDNLLNIGGQKKSYIKKPFLSDDELQNDDLKMAYEALCAYIDAFNDGAEKNELQAIKDDFESKLGIVIYEDNDGLLAVKDSNGNDILVNG